MQFRRNPSMYNPENDPEARLITAGEAEIYVVDFLDIARVVHNDQKKLILDDAVSDGPLLASRLTVEQTVDKTTREFRWIYNGVVTWGDNYKGVQDSFFRQVSSDSKADFDLEAFHFSNARLLVAKRSGALSRLAIMEPTRSLHYNNEVAGCSSLRPLVTVGLNAPTLSSLNRQPGHQFEAHVKGYVYALNALSKVLGGGPAITKLAVTPDGPLYPTGRKGKYSRKRTPNPAETTPETSPEPEAAAETEPPVKKVLMLDDLGGLDTIKQDLKKVVLSFKNPEIMSRWGAERPQGILFYGPPGTGKTSLAKALANEIEAELWEIKSSEIYDKWHGNSEKNMQAIFDEARQKTEPTLMLFDEFEALINTVEGDTGAARAVNAVVRIFKTEVARLREENPNIIIAATTNAMENIDDSLIRAGRFDQKHYVPLPDSDGRIQIFSNNIADAINTYKTDSFVPFADDINIRSLAEATDGLSGADIVEILRRANFSKAMEEAAGKKASPITQQELLDIIQDMKTD